MNTKTFNRQKLINIVTALMTVDDECFIKTLKNILKEIKNLNSTKNEYIELPRAKARGFLFHRKQP